MTLMIEMPPELESRLKAEAEKRGQDAAAYARTLLESLLLPARERPLYEGSLEEWKRAFREWGEAHRTDTPAIPLEALRRENLYEDRGL
jgi:predicted DNA-binding protein